jgi:hypothetical protein
MTSFSSDVSSLSRARLRFSVCIGLATLAQAAVAQDFPSISPKLQAQLEVVVKDFSAARSNLAQRFAWPTGTPAALPCDGVTEELYRLGGVVKQDDEANQKLYARMARQSGMLPGSFKPPEFKVKQFHLVKAQCKAGKLDGEIEGWLDYDMVMDSAINTSTTSYRTHFKALYTSGKPSYDSNVTARWQSGSKSTFKDPAIEKMMSASRQPQINVAIFGSDSPLGNISTMYMTMDGKAKLTTTVVDVESPPPKLRTTMTMYQRAQLISESKMRNGQQHGWMIMHPHTDMMLGIPIPGSKTCFEEGELIKSNTCDVD